MTKRERRKIHANQPAKKKKAPSVKSKRKPREYAGRLKLAKISDDYIIGVISGKLNISKYTTRWIRDIRTNPDRSRLYNLGINDCELFTLKDIRHELYSVMRSNPDLLYKMIGRRAYSNIIVACHGLSDGEIRAREEEMKNSSRVLSKQIDSFIKQKRKTA